MKWDTNFGTRHCSKLLFSAVWGVILFSVYKVFVFHSIISLFLRRLRGLRGGRLRRALVLFAVSASVFGTDRVGIEGADDGANRRETTRPNGVAPSLGNEKKAFLWYFFLCS